MVLATYRGENIGTSRSLWEHWIKNGRSCQSYYHYMDLKNHDLWKHGQTGRTVRSMHMKAYTGTDNDTYTTLYLSLMCQQVKRLACCFEESMEHCGTIYVCRIYLYRENRTILHKDTWSPQVQYLLSSLCFGNVPAIHSWIYTSVCNKKI